MFYTSDPNDFLEHHKRQNQNVYDPANLVWGILSLLMRVCHWGIVCHPAAFFPMWVTPALVWLGCGAWGVGWIGIGLLLFLGAAGSLTYGFYFEASLPTRLVIVVAYGAAFIYQLARGFDTQSALLFMAGAFAAVTGVEAWAKKRGRDD